MSESRRVQQSGVTASVVTPWPEAVLDRLGEVRGDEALVGELFDGSRVLPVTRDGRFPVRSTPAGHVLVGSTGGAGQDAGGAGGFDARQDVLLGRLPGGGVWFARPVDDQVSAAWEEAGTLRLDDLPDAEREVAAAAVALLGWHALEVRCERCGEPTTMVAGGGSRRCGNGHESFPRTDPAVIMAVVDADDRLLLAHQATWPEGRCSVLAGFVEAGESAEATVARECQEEVGLRVHDVRYLRSQAWPFPRSLMLAYAARADGEPRPDGIEIAWARWFTRQEVLAELDAGTLTLPGLASIAGRMVQRWLANQL